MSDTTLHHIFEPCHSKEEIERVAKILSQDPRLLADACKLFATVEHYRILQRITNTLLEVHRIDRSILFPHLGILVDSLEQNPEVPVKRNVLRILQYFPQLDMHENTLLGKVIEYLESTAESVAVRAFAMTVLYNISQNHPELRDLTYELVLYNVEREDATPGILSRGKKILGLLAK